MKTFQWWATQKALTDPKYHHLWDGLVMAMPPIGRGNRIPDLSPSRGHGVLTNMDPQTDWLTTEDGALLDIAATGSQHVKCGGSRIADYPFTFVAWMEKRAGQGVSITSANSTVGFQYIRLGMASGVIFARIVRSGVTDLSGSTPLLDGTLYMIAMTGASSTDRKLYLNGVEDATDSTAQLYPFATDVTWLGGIGDATPTYWGGLIGATFIWNRVLSPRELRFLYETRLDMFRFSPPWWGFAFEEFFDVVALKGEFDYTEQLKGEFDYTKSLKGEFDYTKALKGEFDYTELLDGEFDYLVSLKGKVDQ